MKRGVNLLGSCGRYGVKGWADMVGVLRTELFKLVRRINFGKPSFLLDKLVF